MDPWPLKATVKELRVTKVAHCRLRHSQDYTLLKSLIAFLIPAKKP
jgi:hypothetical protein